MSGEISTTVIETVARAEGVGPTELPPLYDVVDPDALDGLFTRSNGTDSDETLEVRFEYVGYFVTARSDGDVELRGAATNGNGASNA